MRADKRVFVFSPMSGGLASVAVRADLQLILAVDASESVNDERFELQMHGYAAAVLDAIGKGARGRIAIRDGAVDRAEKAGAGVRLDGGARSCRPCRRHRRGAPPSQLRGTSISGAVLYALQWFDRSPMPGARRVIDISGDSANNSGRPIAEVRDEAVAAGVTINGLPILRVEPGLAEHYRDEVIGRRGAFMIAIDDYEGFAEAIQIAGTIPLSSRRGIDALEREGLHARHSVSKRHGALLLACVPDCQTYPVAASRERAR